MKRIGVVGIPGAWSSETLAESVAARTGHRCLIDMEQVTLSTDSGQVTCDGTDLLDLDALIVKKITRRYSPDIMDRLEILRYVADRGVRVFSDPSRIMRLVDRLSCTVTLALEGIPIPPTVVAEDEAEVGKAVKRFGRAVLKPLFTSKARGMVVVENNHRTLSDIRDFRASGNRVVYVQKMVDIPEKDLGLVFLGGEYLATYARVRSEGSWNTTTRSSGTYVAYEPDPETVSVARRAQALFGLDYTSVDCVETPDGPLVFEVSAFGGFRGLYETGDLRPGDLLAEYVLRRLGK
jgi:ribosomal protein S6--L-glutamate ligase